MGCPCPWVTMRNAANQPPPLLAGLQRLPPAGARTYRTGLCSAFTVGACHLSAPLPLCSVRALSSAGAVFPPPHMPSLNRRPHSGLCQCPPCICFPQPVRGKASLRPLCVLTERPHPSLPCTTVTCVCADLPTRGHPCSRGAGIKSALPLHRSMLRPALHRGLSEVIAKPS